VFYGDTSIAQSAQLKTRYGTQSLKGVLLDIHFLSLTDYLVCTFSSQVKRKKKLFSNVDIVRIYMFKFRSVVLLMK